MLGRRSEGRESEGSNMHWTVPVYMVVTHNWAMLGGRGAQSHQSLLDGRECQKWVSGYLDAITGGFETNAYGPWVFWFGYKMSYLGSSVCKFGPSLVGAVWRSRGTFRR